MLPSRSWRAGRYGAIAGLSFAIFFCSEIDSAWAQKNRAKTPRKPATASPTASGSPGEVNLTNIPLPVGHDARGLVLPDFDSEGHLRGRFIAGSARRIDEEHVSFTDLKITTFTEDNQNDLQVNLSTAVFNLKTKVLSSKERGTVERADFNIIGDSLDFDTDKRTGHMVGHIKMVIKSNSKLIEQENE
jgi:hypothetical protein